MPTDSQLRIFGAIDELFKTGGIEQVTMSRIGALCGMHKGSLLYHFKTKEAMLLSYYEHYLKEHDAAFFDEVERIIADGDGGVKNFCLLIDLILSVNVNKPSLRDIATSDIVYLASKDSQIAELLDAKFHRMEAFLRQKLLLFGTFGILDELRFDDSISDLLFNLSAVLYFALYGISLPRHPETVRRAVTRVKMSFIKDALHRDII